MKKVISTLIISLVSLTASANELTDLRKDIGTNLNETVKEIKDAFKGVESQLSSDNTEIKEIYRTSKMLKESSEEVETNPTVLKHGKKSVEDCQDTKELIWDGNDWTCQEPDYKTDCIAANDEYKYESPVGSGNYVCKKSQSGHEITYKWEFRANSNECDSSGYRKKVYRCFYVNKNGQEIDVEESYCGKSSDLTNEKGEVCPIPWSTGAWGKCEEVEKCGWSGSFKDGQEWTCRHAGYKQTRSVYCKEGFTCEGSKPAETQSCTPSSSGDRQCGNACEGGNFGG
tara:strand:+ start:929 stop:1783 length:855 start_codon:yes stop_codon:yes gene_type:complete